MVCSGELHDGNCHHCSLKVAPMDEGTLHCRNLLMKEAAETIYNIFEIIKKLYKV